jgi:regulator of replication initiation timing
MALSFTFAVDKMQSPSIGRAEGHNLRLHNTQSQLRKAAWFTPEGRHEVEPWRPDVLARAKGLAKRKDAVQAIQFVIQIGNQTDWRHEPEQDFPEGRPMKIADAMNSAARGIRAWVEHEFGEDNCVGIDLHTDESSPHFHVVVTPVRDGKLRAKAWLDGPSKLAALRKRAWQAVNAHIKCEYSPGALGGAPHDPTKAAGQTPTPSLVDKMTGHARAKALELENAELRKRCEALEQVQFSRQKTRYRAEMAAVAEKAQEDAAKAVAGQKSAVMALLSAEIRVQQLQETIERQAKEIQTVHANNAKLADENNELLEKLREHSPSQLSGGLTHRSS